MLRSIKYCCQIHSCKSLFCQWTIRNSHDKDLLYSGLRVYPKVVNNAKVKNTQKRRSHHPPGWKRKIIFSKIPAGKTDMLVPGRVYTIDRTSQELYSKKSFKEHPLNPKYSQNLKTSQFCFISLFCFFVVSQIQYTQLNSLSKQDVLLLKAPGLRKPRSCGQVGGSSWLIKRSKFEVQASLCLVFWGGGRGGEEEWL